MEFFAARRRRIKTFDKTLWENWLRQEGKREHDKN